MELDKQLANRGLVDGFANDVFVSFAHRDNTDTPDGKRWAAQFVYFLEQRVRRGIPQGKFQLWFDAKRLDGGHSLQHELEASVKGSAILLCLVSQGYKDSEWCTQEREWFKDAADSNDLPLIVNGRHRMMKVSLLGAPEVGEELLDNDAVGFPFWEPSPEADLLKEFLPHPTGHRDGRYWKALEELTEAIVATLTEIRSISTGSDGNASQSPDAADVPNTTSDDEPAASQDGDPETGTSEATKLTSSTDISECDRASADIQACRGTVYLAQCTDDVQTDRRSLQRDLRGNRIRVIPIRASPPFSREALEPFVKSRTGKAAIAVHMMGTWYGRRLDDDEHSSLPKAEVEAARGNIDQLIWVKPQSGPVEDTKQREWIEELRNVRDLPSDAASMKRFDVMENVSLERLKSDIIRRFPDDRTTLLTSRPRKPVVYVVGISREELGQHVVQEASAWLKDRFSLFRKPLDRVSDGSLNGCGFLDAADGVLVVCGLAGDVWGEQRLLEAQDLVQLRRKVPLPVCLYAFPPDVPNGDNPSGMPAPDGPKDAPYIDAEIENVMVATDDIEFREATLAPFVDAVLAAQSRKGGMR